MIENINHQSVSQDRLTPEDVSHLVETLRPLRKYSRIGAAALTAVIALSSVLPVDIAIGKANVENSSPIIHPITEALDQQLNNIPTFYMDGFARQDSTWQATKMQFVIQKNTDGSEVDALEYSEKGISIDKIAQKIAEYLEPRGLKSVSLYGYSVGGEASLLVAGVLIHKYGIRVVKIYTDHTPADTKSIRPVQRETAAAVLRTLEFFEGFGLELQYSSIARSIVNQNIPGDLTYINDVSSSLIIDQYSLGSTTDTGDAISNLKSHGNPTPVVINVTSSDPNSDKIIDLKRSDEIFRKETKEADIPYVSLEVDGGPHGLPNLIINSYKDVFLANKSVIDEKVEQAESLHRLQNGTSVLMRIFTHR